MNPASDSMQTPDQVLAYLQTRLAGGQTVEQAHVPLAELAAESAWVYLGGSGARIRVYRLGGELRAAVRFDAGDRLWAYGAYLDTQPWAADSAGMLAAAFPDASLTWIVPAGFRPEPSRRNR
jgi:hypothetical protein